MEQYLEAGKIINTFGIKGEVKLEPWCDSAAFLRPVKRYYLNEKELKVVSARVHKELLIVHFEGYDDINAAMTLKNKILKFDRNDVHLPANRVFISDILGSVVIDEQDKEIGKLTEVLELPMGQVYVVQGEEEHTIPAVPEFILNVNAQEHTIRVHLIEGM